MNSKVIKALKDISVPVNFIKRDNKVSTSISFFVVNGMPSKFEDDGYEYIEHLIQIDIWAEYGNSITKITKDVINAMEVAGFTLSSIRADMYESDTNIVHKPIEFRYLEQIK